MYINYYLLEDVLFSHMHVLYFVLQAKLYFYIYISVIFASRHSILSFWAKSVFIVTSWI